VMDAITGRYGAGEAAVLALEAGADLVLMPADADAAIEAILAALANGRLSEERLEASLERRRQALERCRTGPPTAEQEPVSGPRREDRALALELVRCSLERQGPPLQALAAPAAGVNLIRLDSSLGCAFLPLGAPALALPATAGFEPCLIDSRCPSPWSGAPEAPLALERLGSGPVLLQLFVRGNPFRGRADGGEPWPAVIRQLQQAGRLAGLTVLGSPYLWEQLRQLLTDDIPAAFSPGQMPLAQAELLASLGLGAGQSQGDGFTD